VKLKNLGFGISEGREKDLENFDDWEVNEGMKREVNVFGSKYGYLYRNEFQKR